MNFFALLAETAQAEVPAETDILRLVLEYLLYAAIIVIGIFILLLLRRKTRLPRHKELRDQLQNLSESLESLSKTNLSGLKSFKTISKLIYRTDKLIYVTDCMADKERDGQIGNISTLLGQVRNELASYKLGSRLSEDTDGTRIAHEKAAEAVVIIERVLARDAQLKGVRA